MRPELTIHEQIDLYLAGKLSPAEQAAIEEKMANDPSFENSVNAQKDLIRSINRKALRAQINTVAAGAAGGGGGATFGNLFLGIGGVLAVGIIATTLVYLNSKDSQDLSNANQNPIVQTTKEYHDSDDVVTDRYDYESEDQLILETPETIFSSYNTYDEEREHDQMNVTVHFQSRGLGEKVVYEDSNSAAGEEVIDKKNTETIERDVKKEGHKTKSSRARYPGGNSAMDKFIDRNLSYPKSAWDKGIEGVVRCEFFVTEDGLISEIDAECIKMSERDGEAFNDMRQLMNKRLENAFIGNATHILRTMPIWEPATNSQGNPVLSRQRMYFNYDLERGCLVYQLDDGIELE